MRRGREPAYVVVDLRAAEAADVLDLYGMRLRLPVRAALAEGRVRVNVIVRLQAVIRVREVEELGSDGLGFSRHDVGTER